MFDTKRYATKGIMETIPLELQLYMWSQIDILRGKGEEMDYLQVFELKPVLNSDGIPVQSICHKQEVPPRDITTEVQTEDILSEKIFVIDSSDYVTMLLSSEY